MASSAPNATYTAGSTYEWALAATADGEPFDLTGCTVKLRFRKPDGTTFELVATVTNGPGGLAQVQNDDDDLAPDSLGGWRRSWEIVHADGRIRSIPIAFRVIDTP